MSYTLTTDLQTDAAGQTVSAQLIDTAGADVGTAVTTGFVDIGLGFYIWTYASFPDGFRGAIKFSVAGVLKSIVAVNPQEGENADTKTSTRADAAQYTTARAAKLDNLDVVLSTRLAASAYTTPPTTAAIRDAVLNELLSGHTGAGSVGEALGRLDAAVTTRADASVYTSSRAALLDRLDVAVSTRLATSGYTVPPTVAAVVAGVLDELVASHAGAGSVGAFLARLDAAVTTRAAITDWTSARATKVDNLDATVSSRAAATALATLQTAVDAVKTVVDAVKAKTDRLKFATNTGTDDISSTPSAAGVAAIWNALSSALVTSGSIGKRLVDTLDVAMSTRASSNAFDDLVINVSEIVDPLTKPVPSAYPSGSAGDALGRVMDLFRVTPIVTDRETITVVRGTDYTGDHVLSLTNLRWADLTGAVVTLRAQVGTHYLNKTLTVIAPRLVSLSLNSAETNALEPAQYVGELHASLADGSSVVLQRIVVDATYAAGT